MGWVRLFTRGDYLSTWFTRKRNNLQLESLKLTTVFKYRDWTDKKKFRQSGCQGKLGIQQGLARLTNFFFHLFFRFCSIVHNSLLHENNSLTLNFKH